MDRGAMSAGGMSRELRGQLIEEVRRRAVLYDTRHPHHRDADVRDKCWAEISDKLGHESDLLKREWKILRDSLRQALKKSREGALTKAGLPPRKWQFQQKMSFLLPYMTRRPRPQNGSGQLKVEVDVEPEQQMEESEEWQPEERGGEEAAGAGAGLDALELFFASVCASARRLPPPAQRRLKRRVLDALLAEEARADETLAAPPPPADPGAPADSSRPGYDDEF